MGVTLAGARLTISEPEQQCAERDGKAREIWLEEIISSQPQTGTRAEQAHRPGGRATEIEKCRRAAESDSAPGSTECLGLIVHPYPMRGN